jgi:hypothetical protein
MGIINLLELELAPTGHQPAVISSVADGLVKDKRGRITPTFAVEATLAAKRSDGVPFVIIRNYKKNSKGMKSLIADAISLRAGKPFTTEELKQFDPKPELFGKSCFASVGRTSEGGKTVACVTAFTVDPACTVKLLAEGQTL